VDEQRGGVLLRVPFQQGESALGFIPADVAKRITALSSLTPVPGAAPSVAGLALADGHVVTVLKLAGFLPGRDAWRGRGDDWIVPGADRAVLCTLGGFDVALTGGVVVATGVFDADPSDAGVLWHGEVVPVLDVPALYALAEAGSFARTIEPGGREFGR
jgi:chemotaxis signal transduction protein